MFEAKEKEPKLSADMQGILNRSMGDRDASEKVDDIYRSKYKIMKLLTENQDILNTLHNDDLAGVDEVINGDTYRDVCIFDFLKLPDNKSEVKNYVCFEINDNGWGETTEKTIIFRCVSHIDDARTDWGIPRQDLLAAIIKNQFDWSNVLGMRLRKDSDNGRVTDDGYYYREVIYRCTDALNPYQRMHQRANR